MPACECISIKDRKEIARFGGTRQEIRVYYTNLFGALKVRIKTQQQLDEHRRQGHIQYSPDCPECKRGAAKQRAHYRAFTSVGG